MDMEIKNLLAMVEGATMESAKIIMSRFNQENESSLKLDKSIVTQVDLDSEKIILDALKKATPEYLILAEESGLSETESSEYTWIVDPLDGTTNYSQRIPLFAVQIALVHKGKVILGVINLPYENLLLSAIRGAGLFVNGKKIDMSKTSSTQSLMLFETYLDDIDLDILKKAKEHVDNIRIINSACVSMAYLALGRANIVIDRVDKPWDLAAGSLIVEESGGKVTNPNGGEFNVFDPKCVASKGFDHARALNILK